MAEFEAPEPDPSNVFQIIFEASGTVGVGTAEQSDEGES